MNNIFPGKYPGLNLIRQLVDDNSNTFFLKDNEEEYKEISEGDYDSVYEDEYDYGYDYDNEYEEEYEDDYDYDYDYDNEYEEEYEDDYDNEYEEKYENDYEEEDYYSDHNDEYMENDNDYDDDLLRSKISKINSKKNNQKNISNRLSKPIDKWINVKTSFKNLMKKDVDYSILKNAIIRTNILVIRVLQFMRYYVLFCIDNNKDIPLIDMEFVKMAFKALSQHSAGPKPTFDNLINYNNLLIFYDVYFHKVLGISNNDDQKISATNLSSILQAAARLIVTNLNNNIWMHYMNHIRQFVNQMFKTEHDIILEQLTGEDKTLKRAELRRETKKIKDALIENKELDKKCDKRYHTWLNLYRNKILPVKFFTNCSSFQDDLKNSPQSYFKYMVNTIRILEANDLKLFQFFPLRTEMVVKYIEIDTKTVIDLFATDKNKYLSNVEQSKEEIWRTYFKLDNRIFHRNKKDNNKQLENIPRKYLFDYTILTDMMGASIRLIHESFYEKNKLEKENMIKAKAVDKEKYGHLTKNKKKKIKDKLKEEAKLKKQKEANDRKIKKKLESDAFKKLPKEERDRINLEKRQKSIDEKKVPYVEFPYITELVQSELDDLTLAKRVYVDPGKRCLLFMIDDNGNIFEYTNKSRMYHTKRLKYQKTRLLFKKKHNMIKLETELSEHNSKSCDILKFSNYIKKKDEVYKTLFDKYMNPIFRKLKWFTYINTQKEDMRLLNNLVKFYGEDVTFIIGDWSEEHQMKNFISTPGKHLKQLLTRVRPNGKQFKVYTLDEFRTSCLHHETEQRVGNLYLPYETKSTLAKNRKDLKEEKNNKKVTNKDIPKKVTKRDIPKKVENKSTDKQVLNKMHSILTYIQMSNSRMGCINRDLNSVLNMRKIVRHFLITGERLKRYRRDVYIEPYKIPVIKNPSISTPSVT